MNESGETNKNDRHDGNTATVSTEIKSSGRREKLEQEELRIQSSRKREIAQKKMKEPGKTAMKTIQILLIIYLLSGCIILGVFGSGALIGGGITYLLSVLGLIAFSYLGTKYPWKLAKCLSITYVFYFVGQLILTLLNLVYLIASTSLSVVFLLAYMFIGFFLITIGTKIAREYSKDTKAFYDQYTIVFSIND